MNPMDPQMFQQEEPGIEEVIASLAAGAPGGAAPPPGGPDMPPGAPPLPGDPMSGTPSDAEFAEPNGPTPPGPEDMAMPEPGMGPGGEVPAPPGGLEGLPPELLQALMGGGGAPPMGPPMAPEGPPAGGPPMEPMAADMGGMMGADPAQAMASEDGRQTTQQVGYDWGICCGVCVHFIHPESCELVNGHIRQDAVCQLFEVVPGLPADPAYGD
jgi:hypothetical protein